MLFSIDYLLAQVRDAAGSVPAAELLMPLLGGNVDSIVRLVYFVILSQERVVNLLWYIRGRRESFFLHCRGWRVLYTPPKLFT